MTLICPWCNHIIHIPAIEPQHQLRSLCESYTVRATCSVCGRKIMVSVNAVGLSAPTETKETHIIHLQLSEYGRQWKRWHDMDESEMEPQ